MQRWFPLLLALLATPGSGRGQAASTFDQRVREGQEAIYRLDYGRAEQIFRELIRQYPDHPAGYGMLSVTLWNQLLFAAGNLTLSEYGTPTPFSNEPIAQPIEKEEQRFREATEALIQVCDRLLTRNSRDVGALYFKGLAYENLAGEAIAISKSSGAAIRHGKTAKVIHEQVLSLDPGFADAEVSIAGNEFARATLPWSIKWLAFLLGIRGSKERAFQRLRVVVERGKYRHLDAQVLLAVLQAWKGDPRVAVSIFEKLRRQYPENFLFDFNLAAIYDHALQDPRSALQVYQELLTSLESKAPGLHKGEILYRIGKTYLRLHEYSMALEAFRTALTVPRGEPQTEPLAYFHMARIHEEQGARNEARRYYRQVVNYSGPKTGIEEEMETARKKLD